MKELSNWIGDIECGLHEYVKYQYVRMRQQLVELKKSGEKHLPGMIQFVESCRCEVLEKTLQREVAGLPG